MAGAAASRRWVASCIVSVRRRWRWWWSGGATSGVVGEAAAAAGAGEACVTVGVPRAECDPVTVADHVCRSRSARARVCVCARVFLLLLMPYHWTVSPGLGVHFGRRTAAGA